MLKNQIKQCWFKLARFLCGVFCWSFFRMRFYGLENIPSKGPFLLLSNHQSYLDPLFCGIRARRVLCFVARDSLFTRWPFGAILRSVNAIPIRRGQADISALRKVVEKLRAGFGVCIFPEATRTKDGRIAAIKPGFSLLSRRGNAPVVPVVVDGPFEAWPRHRKMVSMGEITVCFAKPITAQQVRDAGDAEFAKLITEVLRKMQNDCRAKQGKKTYDYND